MKFPTRVLIIGTVWPEPRSSAAGIHMMQLIEQFQRKGWEVIFASPAQPGENRADLAALGIQEATITLNNTRFDIYVKALNPDIVLFDRFMMEEQFGWRVAEHCPQALRVLETSDLHCLRAIRHQLLKAHPHSIPDLAPAELYREMATQDMTQREIASIYRCDLSLMISDVEINLLTEQFRVPAALLHYCPLMLDTPDTQTWPAHENRKGFITIGNFLHEPNWDSVLWLKQAIWPLIRHQLPDAELFIYGAYTPQKALALHQPKQGFHVLGWAEDSAQVVKNARVFLAPLRFGAGIKGKLAEAMLCGTPSVTTTIGAESMSLLDNSHTATVHNTAEAFAHAAVSLYQDQSAWQHAQQHGLSIIHQRFNKQVVAEHLITRIENCRRELGQHRGANFTGLMLQHHQHKSTTYLARWIEAKNKLLTSRQAENTAQP